MKSYLSDLARTEALAIEIAAELNSAMKGSGGAQNDFVDADPVRWIEKHFFIPELRGPLVLAPYQKKALREGVALEPDGLFRYSIILWSDIKKSIKSTIAAAVILWRAFQVDAESGWGSFYIIANDLKQADSRVAYYLRRAIQLNPDLRAVCQVRNYKVTLPNKTFIEAIPIDPTGEAGSNADGMVFSELWGAHGKAISQMWVEMTLSPTKFGKSFRWIETYAGYRDRSEILLGLYQQAVKPEHRLDDDLEMFADKGARLFALWNTRPRLSWQTPEYYAQEESALAAMPDEFARVHRNQWSEGSNEKYVAINLWDACLSSAPVELSKHVPLVLAVDGAYAAKGDVFAAVPAHQDGNTSVIYDPLVWEAKGEPRDLEDIQDQLKNFCIDWNVVEIAYDPTQLVHMMQHLEKPSMTRSGREFRGVPTFEFSQQQERTKSDKYLLDAIVSRKIRHGGNLILRQHLDNADRKMTDDRKLRIVKRTSGQKNDAAVALSMAVWRLHNLFHRGLVVTTYRPESSVVSWARFAQKFGRQIPAHWEVAAAVRLESDAALPSGWVIVARAGENAYLGECVFVVASSRSYVSDPAVILNELRSALIAHCANGVEQAGTIWLSANSPNILEMASEKFDLSLSYFKGHADSGLSELNWYLETRRERNPFSPDVDAARGYLLVEDNQMSAPLNDHGLLSTRQELVSWSYGDNGEPQPYGGITLDCLRMTLSNFALTAARMSDTERRIEKLPENLKPAVVMSKLGTSEFVDEYWAMQNAVRQARMQEEQEEKEFMRDTGPRRGQPFQHRRYRRR